MLPTIDISLIGIVLAIWNVFKTIWDYTTRALNWITQRALSVFIGSKFWATAAFMAAGVLIIGLVSGVVALVLQTVASFAAESLSVEQGWLDFVFLYIPADEFVSMFSVATSCLVAYFGVVNLDFARRGLVHLFTILSRSWKT